MITVDITWCSDDSISYPDSVDLEFSEEEIKKIERLIKIAKKEQVTIKFEIQQVSSSELEAGDFEPNLEFIQIFKDGDLSYEGQNDESIMINSDFFTLKDIK